MKRLCRVVTAQAALLTEFMEVAVMQGVAEIVGDARNAAQRVEIEVTEHHASRLPARRLGGTDG